MYEGINANALESICAEDIGKHSQLSDARFDTFDLQLLEACRIIDTARRGAKVTAIARIW